MARLRQLGMGAAVMAALVAAPALAQPAATDGPVPTARYERPPAGVDPSILNRPLPDPEPAPVRRPPPPAQVAMPIVVAPDVAVRRRGPDAPASLETTTAMPRERLWGRQPVGRPSLAPPSPPPPTELPGMRTATLPAAPPRIARAAPAPAAPMGRTVELQIGAFTDRDNADRAARTARAAGPTRIQSVTVGGTTYHRVVVGPASEGPMRAALANLGFREARAVHKP